MASIPESETSRDDDLERILSQLRMMTREQVQHIDRLLAEVGQYGEVHLVVEHGKLRFINQIKTRDVQ